jgi:hypothetical protein
VRLVKYMRRDKGTSLVRVMSSYVVEKDEEFSSMKDGCSLN